MEAAAKKSNFRKWVLVTLSRADASEKRAAVTREEIAKRIEINIKGLSIIVAREEYADKGHHHFYVGILLEKGVHRLSAPRTFRKMFPELEGAPLNVSIP